MSLTLMTTPTAVACWTVVSSPVDELRLVARGEALVAIEFAPFRREGDALGERADDHPVLRRATAQLAEYFAGERHDFDLPLAPGGSDFQREVWRALLDLGYGATASYGEIARGLGRTNAASRAVGLANGRNPIPVVVPCHRVVGADGTLTGYAGGLARKQTLLDLERDAAAQLF